jgi:transcriptional regulator with XRE-family HTH domain
MRRGTSPRAREKIQGRPDPIGQRIKDLRTARGMTLQTLAEMVGIAPSHVFHVENGDKVPGEDLAVEIARALHDDEELYRAWARARSRSDFFTAVESAGVLAQYMRGVEKVRAEADPAAPESDGLRWQRPRVSAAPESSQGLARFTRFGQEAATTRPARLLVPVIAAGADPGQGREPFQPVGEMRLDPRTLDPAEPLERPFACLLTAATTSRVEGLLPDRGVAIFTRRVIPVVAHEIYAVRHQGHIVLSRAMWNGRELLLLPAAGRSDFIVLPAASEAEVAQLIAGRVAVVRAEP